MEVEVLGSAQLETALAVNFAGILCPAQPELSLGNQE